MGLEESELEKILKIALPVAGALAGFFLAECTGLSEHMQNYQFEKICLVDKYFGFFFKEIQSAVAYVSRIGVDLFAVSAGLKLGNKIYDRSQRL